MKHFQKLNAKGFAHWVIPALAIAIIGGIGSYILLRPSHADVSPVSICGSGFVIKKTQPLSTTVGATQYLLVNNATKQLCATMVSTGSFVGRSRYLETHLSMGTSASGAVSNPPVYKQDYGAFKYYAGPLYASYDGRSSWYAHVWGVASTTTSLTSGTHDYTDNHSQMTYSVSSLL